MISIPLWLQYFGYGYVTLTRLSRSKLKNAPWSNSGSYGFSLVGTKLLVIGQGMVSILLMDGPLANISFAAH